MIVLKKDDYKKSKDTFLDLFEMSNVIFYSPKAPGLARGVVSFS